MPPSPAPKTRTMVPWPPDAHPLDVIFRPRGIALIGAGEQLGSTGRQILWNLLSNPFGGAIFPVNAHQSTVLGIRTYPSVQQLPDPVDLVIIAKPAPEVPGIVRACIAAGIGGAIIVSAGFKETGPAGAELEDEILALARSGNMRIIGPNCMGVMSPITGLNASTAAGMARKGTVGFISQSGALGEAILDWSFRENVGFSTFISVGTMLDVGWGELIDYLGADTQTKSIVIYMETIGDARAFMSAAREAALAKPIIVIKPGRTAAASQAAATHTGAMCGNDDVIEAAFIRSGVLRVETISDLFNMAEVLAKQPHPRGNRLTILTDAGGPAVLATDALIGGGGALAPISAQAQAKLAQMLPVPWQVQNPIDILGDAGPQRYAQALDILADEEESDGLLVILTPQAPADPTATARIIIQHAAQDARPLLASWMGGEAVAAGAKLLNEANIPTFSYPDTACRVFNYMWRYSSNLRGLYETAGLATETEIEDWGAMRNHVAGIIADARGAGRVLLSEIEAKRVLSAYGIPTVTTRYAKTADEAAALAAEIGHPVVLKLHSDVITHKSAAGGVRLYLTDEAAVRIAFREIARAVTQREGPDSFQGVTVQPMIAVEHAAELIVGCRQDAQFGPVLLFGAGGALTEIIRDRSLALPPLTTTLARRMMQGTRIYRGLQGHHGLDPVDLEELERLITRFSVLVVEHPRIKEVEINPLLATSEQLLALDARIVLHEPDVPECELPRPAIRPYPTRYVDLWTAPDGVELRIRPIYPADEPKLVRFHEGLSEQTVYLRYFQSLNIGYRVAHDRLTRKAFIDYDREMVLVATYTNPDTELRDIAAIGRLSKSPARQDAEFALLVADAFQGKKLGTELLRRLLQVARDEGVQNVFAYMLPDNHGMRRVCQKLGFSIRWERDLVEAIIDPWQATGPAEA